ncbi:hypothetical protein [Paraliomyxa miuraensis]|uniref:hypothetical protein n=1 Tax=Paraliomyxa miuraensis TaxID=376150 RepID=UPI00224DFD87|nr:hypothetical protein [Paraliomyxa miuraensis]MCX4242602.1 hypothetical protein [Paraliomyxa miuraensis]
MTPLFASFLFVAAAQAEAPEATTEPESTPESTPETTEMVAAPLDAAPDGGDQRNEDIAAKPDDADEEYGPFFEPDAPSDTSFPTTARKGKAPLLSVANGALCFVDGSHCKVSLLADASVAAGLRAPASNKGPDVPYAHYAFRGGLVMRPLMLGKKDWHPWGLGVVGSWSMGTGVVVVESMDGATDQGETDSTPAVRVGVVNQLWLSQRPHAMHIDFTLGAVRSPVLDSGIPLVGTHAEVAFGWGGWGAVYASGDFLDQDTRIGFGVRAHGIAAAPLIALAVLGAGLGGAL